MTDNQIVKQGFGSMETRGVMEVASTAMAAMVEAEVKARYIMAMQNPRDIDQFRQDLLKEVERPYFVDLALQSGTMLKFKIPKGKEKNPATGRLEQKYIEDVSIRFIELAIRCFKNVDTNDQIIFESPDLRLVKVTVIDLENNIPKGRTLAISKTVERKGEQGPGSVWGPPKGRVIIGQPRMNSYNEPVYTCEPTDDELKAKQNAEVQKTIRTLGKQILPGDIVAEAIEKAEKIIRDKDAKDPDAAKRRIVDLFAKQGVTVSDLESFLDHSLNSLTPKELGELRDVYAAVASGEATWAEAVEKVRGEDEGEPKTKKDSAAVMAEKLRKSQEGKPEGQEPSTEKAETSGEPKEEKPKSEDKSRGFGGNR